VPDLSADLGKLIALHGIAPAYIQRAVFIAVLSFLFFLAMMFAFYIRQNILYFLLASVFLVIYLLMMFSWINKRRSVVEIFENGVRHGKNSAAWGEIIAVSNDGVVELADSSSFALPKSISDLHGVVEYIKLKVVS
jgi:predicted membrane protein